MIDILYLWLRDAFPGVFIGPGGEDATPLRLLHFATFRMVLAFLTAFLVTFLISPGVIAMLYRRGMRDRVRAYASSGTLRDAGAMAEVAERYLDQGFAAMKIRFPPEYSGGSGNPVSWMQFAGRKGKSAQCAAASRMLCWKYIWCTRTRPVRSHASANSFSRAKYHGLNRVRSYFDSPSQAVPRPLRAQGCS